jgi:hypothetical protein
MDSGDSVMDSRESVMDSGEFMEACKGVGSFMLDV